MTDQILVRELTTELEKGDNHNIQPFFSGKFEEERFKDLDAIRKLNEQDRAEGKTTVTLNCEKDFYYNDTIRISATNGSMDEFTGGKLLYDDQLDLSKLKHSDPADVVPGVREPVDIRKLTDATEAGNGKALEAALTGKYQEERASILNQVGALNAADLADHKSDVRLEISVAGPKHAAGNMYVYRQLNNTHDWWMGGVQLYNETLDLETDKRQIQSVNDTRK